MGLPGTPATTTGPGTTANRKTTAMTTLTVPKDRLFADLRPGDQITAIDGRPLHRAQTVRLARHRVSHGGPEAVGLVNLLGTATEWNLYPDSQVDRDVTVDRHETPEHLRAVAPGPDEPSPFLDDYPAYARDRVAYERLEPATPEDLPEDQEDLHPCGCPADVVTSAMRNGGEQCSSCGSTWDRDDQILTLGSHGRLHRARTPCEHDPRYAFPLGPEVTNCTTCGHHWHTADGSPTPYGGGGTAAPRPIRATYGPPLDYAWEARGYDATVRRLFGRKPHFVAFLRACALRPNGVWAVPATEVYARSVGTSLGSLANYGWCRQLDRGIWQVTPAGRAVLAAWDAETSTGTSTGTGPADQ